MILVTGATGFIGSHVLLELLRKDYSVKALIRNNSKKEFVRKIFSYYADNVDELLSKIQWQTGDLLDFHSLEEAMQDVDTIIHCGAVVSFHPSLKEDMYTTNITGTANLVNLALEKGIHKFCHVSSIAALGRTDDGAIITEETHWKSSDRNSQYAITKYGAELEVWRASEEGLPVVIVNPSVVLGPGNWEDGSAKIFSQMYKQSNFYTQGVNGFVDVRDVAKALVLLMESDKVNERYIVSSENLSYKKLFTLIAQNYGKKAPRIEAKPWILSIYRIMQQFQFLLGRKTPLITRETIKTSQNPYYYSNEKICKAVDIEFIPVSKTVEDGCKFFLNDLKLPK
jgi:dihydroflavonol-4-reductase